MDKISVIIPCYNVEKYVAECLDSVVAQKLPGVELEIVCVDDCSQDDTLKILKEYERRYQDVIVLVCCEQNGGAGAARNIGMMYATGEYIGFVDSDDTIAPDMYRKLYEKCVQCDCDMVECGYCEGDILNCISAEDGFIGEDMEEVRRLAMSRLVQSVCIRLYRRSFLVDNGIMFPEGVRYEDIYFAFLCYACLKNMYVVAEPLYYYRNNPESITHSDKARSYYMDRFIVCERIREEMERRGMLDRYREELALEYYFEALGQMVYYMVSENGPGMDMNVVAMITDTILRYFSDVEDNRYVKEYLSEGFREDLKKIFEWRRSCAV